MRILVAGVDGYLGWPLANYLASKRHVVGGIDALYRRRWVREIGSWSALPISSMARRLNAFRKRFGYELCFWKADLREYDVVSSIISEFRPDAVVHLGECPSAPYSMLDTHHAVFVQTNNITTTLNLIFAIRDFCTDVHLLKLGTMGEYGTPNLDIPEGFFDVEYRGRSARLPFPRQAGSWYHWSKVAGSNNLMFACDVYGLCVTDIMQGVVFGTRIDEPNDDERPLTRLDFDECFGTVINRFCCEAVIGHPITPYGEGRQKRGFIPLRDAVQCLSLALENPPRAGEYRVLNQFREIYDVTELAEKIKSIAETVGITVEVRNLHNPRHELERHYYNPDHERLRELGYCPTQCIESEIRTMLGDLLKHQQRIKSKQNVLVPRIQWNGLHRARTLEGTPSGSSAVVGTRRSLAAGPNGTAGD